MGLFKNKTVEATRFEMVTQQDGAFYAWNGKLYHSDIVLSCLRPKVKAIGKLVAKHLRTTIQPDGETKIEVNPEPYIQFLLTDPNPYMTGQKLLERLAWQLGINKNAFALVLRDENGVAREIYPINAQSVETIYDKSGVMYLRFTMRNCKLYTFRYSDVIHLREDWNDNEVFGTSLMPALAPLMEIVTTTDQGLVKAIKNSSVIRWLLKFNTSMRPEDIDKKTDEFAKKFMSIDSGTGVAGVDAKADAQQIDPKDYVPNASTMDRTVNRIYALFNTNDKIVHSAWGEDDWNAYYEAEVEPFAIEAKDQYTTKILTRRQRGCGNEIVFEASNLQCASISTKLSFVQMVDRGAMLPNEWRATFNLAPIPGGNVPIRRLDTAVVKGGEKV